MIQTKEILTYLKDVALATQRISQVEISNILNTNIIQDKQYPLMNLDINNVRLDRTSTIYSIQVVLIDKLTDKINVYDVLTRMQDLLGEYFVLIRKLIENQIAIDYPITLQDIRDTFQDDEVAGWMADVTLHVPLNVDKCSMLLSSKDLNYKPF